jgi:large repetitive protein
LLSLFLLHSVNPCFMEQAFSSTMTAFEGSRAWGFKRTSNSISAISQRVFEVTRLKTSIHFLFCAIDFLLETIKKRTAKNEFLRAMLFAFALLCSLGFSPQSARAATCSYATGQGTAPANWAQFCWLDFSTYDTGQVDSGAGQNFTYTLGDGSILTFNLRRTAGPTNYLTVDTAPQNFGPPYGYSAFGLNAFSGISGSPSIRQKYVPPGGQQFALMVSNIVFKNSVGNVMPGFNFVVADSEATGLGEELTFTTNGGNWAIEGSAASPLGPDNSAVINTGSTIKLRGVSNSSYGSHIVSTREPSNVLISIDFFSGVLGYEGVALAIVRPEADLKITKSNAATSVYAGSSTNYTVTATNSGPAAIVGAVLSDPAVSGLTVTNVVCASTPGVCTPATTPTITQLQSGTYTLPLMPNGATYALSITANITASSGTVSNTASITVPLGTTDTDTTNDSATDTDAALLAPVVATPDSVTGINGATGGANVVNAFTGDTIGGVVANSSNTSLNAITAVPAGLLFNSSTGAVNVVAGTAAGTYTFNYKICDIGNATNCNTASISVAVVAAPIVATVDTPAAVNGATGSASLINAFINDSFNSIALNLAQVTATVTTPASNAGVALNPLTGVVSVAAGIPAGSYSIAYKICENLNVTNCANTTISITILAAPIVATADTPAAVNGATGSASFINAFANDSFNSAALDLTKVTATITSAASNAGVALNPLTGVVSVAAGTPAGNYSIAYKICENLNLANCANNSISVTVIAAPIVATADMPAAVNGASGNPSLINAFTNDSFNSSAIDLIKVTATVTAPASYAGVMLAPATGVVSVAPGTPNGSYTISYKICENLNAGNCASTTITAAVSAASITAANDVPTPVNGAAGNANVINVFSNDTLNASVVTPIKVIASITSPAANAGVALDPATGIVSVALATPAGTYGISYTICEILNPTNCASAAISITVSASAITAATDAPATVNGVAGNSNVINAFANDTLNGVLADPAKITASITLPASNAGVTFNLATGIISVAAATPAGTYNIGYKICEILNPTNCANASLTITVSASAISATADAPAPVNSATGNVNVINAFANDTLNGAAVDPTKITTSITSPASNSGVSLDPVTGIVSVAAATPAGTYSIGYKICETLNPANCASATINITVVAISQNSALSGVVFKDSNGDGRLNTGEPLQRGWIVEAVQNGTVVGSAISNDQGLYKIDTLVIGAHYDIQFRNPENRVVYSVIQNVDVLGNGTVINQNLPIDPSGVIYDSITRAPVAGASATLTDARGASLPAACFIDPSQRVQRTGTSGFYRFDVVPGGAAECPTGETVYSVRITPPAGYTMPSTVLPPQAGAFDPTGRPGPISISPSANPPVGTEAAIYYLDFRLAANDPDIIFNHVPLDPFLTRAPLIVIKTTSKRSVSTGELVPYTITVRNTEAVDRANVDVVDIPPQGFKYVRGTASAEPAQIDRQIIWRAQTIPANSSTSYALSMVVGAGVSGGTKVNTGVARDSVSGADISNRGTATVSITASAVFDCAEVLGKVFEDSNRNGYQDAGERGLPAVRLATVNGQLITTDSFGRYHITCAAVPDARIGSNFVLKVDPRTLPAGYELTQDNPQSIRLTRGKFAELNFGAAPTNASPSLDTLGQN